MKKERSVNTRQLAEDPELNRQFWMASRAPAFAVKQQGPIRPATWDEPFDYFYFDRKRDTDATAAREALKATR